MQSEVQRNVAECKSLQLPLASLVQSPANDKPANLNRKRRVFQCGAKRARGCHGAILTVPS